MSLELLRAKLLSLRLSADRTSMIAAPVSSQLVSMPRIFMPPRIVKKEMRSKRSLLPLARARPYFSFAKSRQKHLPDKKVFISKDN